MTSTVAGWVSALLAAGLALAGTAVLVTDHAARDGSGYLMSPRVFVGTTGYAVTTESLRMHMRGPDTFMPNTMMGDVRITATSRGDRGVFIGIGPTSQSLTWSPSHGTWTVVVMNRDGSPAVAADVRVGAQAPALPWIAGALWVGAFLLALVAVLLIVLPTREARTRPTP